MKQDAGTCDLLKESGKFAVSVLGTGQKDLAFVFFRHVEPDGGEFGDYAYETKTTGAPLIRCARMVRVRGREFPSRRATTPS